MALIHWAVNRCYASHKFKLILSVFTVMSVIHSGYSMWLNQTTFLQDLDKVQDITVHECAVTCTRTT